VCSLEVNAFPEDTINKVFKRIAATLQPVVKSSSNNVIEEERRDSHNAVQ
jgi:hypothetical protein